MSNFKEITPKDIAENPLKLIDTDWMLVTAGSPEKFNMMTASWGGVGILWKKSVAFVFIRPQRYTFEFIEKEEYMTLNFFDDAYKKVLSFCGSNSGRDVDKIEKTHLSPVITDQGIYFEEAKLVLVCKKLYADFLKKDAFLDQAIIPKCYADNDFHKMYVCSIEKVLQK